MKCFCNSWRVRNLLVMVLRLNESLKLAELIHTPDCSGPAPPLVPFYIEFSTSHVLSTMPVKTPFGSPEFSCRKKFTSDSWGLKYLKLHHSEPLQVACQKNLTIRSPPWRVQPTQHHEFKANKDSVKDMDVVPKLKHLEHIDDLEYQPQPPFLRRTETYPGPGAPWSNYVAEPCEPDAKGCLETNLQNHFFYLFATCQEFKYTQCGINK